MNKEYWDYYFSKKKKLTERAFRLRIAMLMTSILACAAVMASSAFALFTCDIKRSTTLTAADFKVLEFNSAQMQNDEQNVINVIHIVTTPGVLGYCKIPVYGTDKTTRFYYTEPFVGEIYFKIATAVGTGIGQPEAFWGDPRNVLDSETELLGIGASVVHSYAAPEQEGDSDSSGGGEGSGGMLTTARPSSGADALEDTPITDNTTDNTTETKKETVTEEKAVETTGKAENSETTVAPSVSEEKASVEKNDSTVVETPGTSTLTSDNSSDSGTSDLSGVNAPASDNGNSSETSSSGNGGNDGSAGAENSSDVGSVAGSADSASSGGDMGGSSPSSDGGGE